MTATEYLAQKFYTPEEAAAVMLLKVSTVRSLIRTGQLKTAKGKTKFVAESEIARYMGFSTVASSRQ